MSKTDEVIQALFYFGHTKQKCYGEEYEGIAALNCIEASSIH